MAALWDKREDEGARAYHCFTLYRDLGPGRSIDKAYHADRAARGQQESSKSRAPRRWFEWAAEHEWKRRAEAFDAHRELEARQLQAEAHREQIRQLADRQRERAARTHQAAMLLLEKGMARLKDLDPEELEPAQATAALRAAAAVAESAGNAEAGALGVEELLKVLGDEPGHH